MANEQRSADDAFSRVSSIPMLLRIHEDLSVALLGILAGAMLVVGVPIIGYWQSLDPRVFLQVVAQHATRLEALLLPLTIIAVITTVITAAGTWLTGAPKRMWFVAAAMLTMAVLALHPVYVAKANAAFQAARTAQADAAPLLSSLRNWQWLRVGLSMLALLASIRGIREADLTALARKPGPRWRELFAPHPKPQPHYPRQRR